jgi:hypothetical protein
MSRIRKEKGRAFERELAEYLSTCLGIPVHRTPMSGAIPLHGLKTNAGGGWGDLLGIPGVCIEAKRVENFRIHAAYEQAAKAAAPDETPIVITRRNHQKTGESYVVLALDDFLPMLSHYLFVPDQETQDTFNEEDTAAS